MALLCFLPQVTLVTAHVNRQHTFLGGYWPIKSLAGFEICSHPLFHLRASVLPWTHYFFASCLIYVCSIAIYKCPEHLAFEILEKFLVLKFLMILWIVSSLFFVRKWWLSGRLANSLKQIFVRFNYWGIYVLQLTV